MSQYKPNIDLQDKNNITTLIYESIKPNSLVLDVGCASGYVAQLLAKKGCTTTGIEIDPEDAKKAERFCQRVLQEDIEEDGWEKELKDEKFDNVIFSDVLEHLKDPLETLRRVKKILKKEGSILISIPNVAHISVRIELLEGNFIPEEIGILDKTHLKYFTKDSFEALVNEAGFKVKTQAASSFDFPEEWLKDRLQKLGLKADKKALELFSKQDAVAYQYFFEIVPGEGKKSIKKNESKPYYIARDFLKSVEIDHKKFKEGYLAKLANLEAENQELRKNQLANKILGKFGKIISKK